MPTIAEILAARKAAATNPPAPEGRKETLAERAEAQAAMDRIDPPGKREAAAEMRTLTARITGLVLNKDMPVPPRENRGQATPVTGPQERALGARQGELIDMTPTGADEPTEAWHSALVSLESELCVMRDPEDPEACWLALRMKSGSAFPLLLHRLPWLLWEHPAENRPPSEPF